MATDRAKAAASFDELREFAKTHTHPSGRECFTCRLPAELLELLRQGRRDHISYRVMSGFLKLKGHEIKPNTIQNHFQNHERGE